MPIPIYIGTAQTKLLTRVIPQSIRTSQKIDSQSVWLLVTITSQIVVRNARSRRERYIILPPKSEPPLKPGKHSQIPRSNSESYTQFPFPLHGSPYVNIPRPHEKLAMIGFLCEDGYYGLDYVTFFVRIPCGSDFYLFDEKKFMLVFMKKTYLLLPSVAFAITLWKILMLLEFAYSSVRAHRLWKELQWLVRIASERGEQFLFETSLWYI